MRRIDELASYSFNTAFSVLLVAALLFAAHNAMDRPIECEQSEVLTYSGHCLAIEDAWLAQEIR